MRDARSSWLVRVCAALALAIAACGPVDVAPLDGAIDAQPRDAAPRADAGPPPEDLEGFVDWQMDVGGIRGLAAAITTPDGVALTLVRGEASEGVAVHAGTEFILASISKTFAAVLVMELVELGLIDLDAPIDDYLPFAVRNPAYPDVAPTTRMFLTHTSGLRDELAALGAAGHSDADPTISLGEFASGYVADATRWESRPGTAYSYTNAGFGVLGALVEAVSGDGFRARSEERLFAPLALDEPGWFIADLDLSRVATPYAWAMRADRYTALPQAGLDFYPAGSLRVSITGMSRWARMIARNGELDGVRVLSEETFAEIRGVSFPSIAADRGLGFEHDRLFGRTFIGHSGLGNGASTRMLVGDDGVGLIVLTNSDAYARNLVGFDEGSIAIRAILERLNAEADRIAR